MDCYTVHVLSVIYEKIRKSDENDPNVSFFIFGWSAAKQGQTYKLSPTE